MLNHSALRHQKKRLKNENLNDKFFEKDGNILANNKNLIVPNRLRIALK